MKPRDPAATLLLCFAWAISFACASPARSSEPTAADVAAMTADVEAVLSEHGIPGAQVALVLPDGDVWSRDFGVRDLASAAPMSDATLMQAGSVTKVFTASLLADLVARGALHWSDTLAERLPGVEMRPEIAAMTLDALATHTAGLPANPPNRVDIDGVMQPYGTAQLYASLSDPGFSLEAEPGRHYSNWGYAILGHVVEKATGRRFEDVLKARIFGPLAMERSRIALSPEDERRLATPYWPEDDPRIARPRWVFGEVAAFGGITSTARDLARFVAYQMQPEARPEVLDPAQVLALREVRVLLPSWGAGGARGWLVVREREGALTWEHSGEVDGYSSYIGFSPELQVGIAVTANLGGSSARRIALPLLSRMAARARAQRSVDRDAALRLARSRQWLDAEAALAKLVVASPRDGEAWQQLGIARYELRDLQGAETALQRAERMVAEPGPVLFMRARIAASRLRVDDAFALLHRAINAPGSDRIDLELVELRPLHTDPRWPKLVAMHLSRRRTSPGPAR